MFSDRPAHPWATIPRRLARSQRLAHGLQDHWLVNGNVGSVRGDDGVAVNGNSLY
jgi:hypothetical protein